MSGAAPIAILSALEEELVGIRRRAMDLRRLHSPASVRLHSARLFGHPVLLVTTGDGAVAAPSGLRWLLARHPVRRLVIVGLGGGLVPDLEVGSVVFAEQVRDVSGASLAPSEEWRRRAGRAALRREIVVSAPRLLGSAAEKATLGRLQDGCEPAVADLESWALATAAARAGCEWAILRAVSDLQHEAIPPVVLEAQDANGAVRRGRVVAGALRRPRTLPTLWALRERTRRCAEQLAEHTERLLTSGS